MTAAEIIAIELQHRGFSAGLIRGFFESGREKWGREIRRCRSDGDARNLATDIAEALKLRLGTKLRAHDFRCPNDGHLFEDFLSYNPYDLDELEAARCETRPCPHCGTISKQVLVRAPGIAVAPWVMSFGGQTYDKDEFDARVDAITNRPKPKRFTDDPKFGERFMSDFEETAVKTMSGELPPPPPIDGSAAADIADAIAKGV